MSHTKKLFYTLQEQLIVLYLESQFNLLIQLHFVQNYLLNILSDIV